MTVLSADSPPVSSSASALAQANLLNNVRALALGQPALASVLQTLPTPSGEWVFARDGSLTLRQNNLWWQGCSLPLRVAQQQLRSLDVGGPVACFLDPPHASHLRVAMDRLKPSQAVLAIVLDFSFLPVLLASEDLTRDIAAHRLWIVAGENWPDQLNALYDAQTGLATPMQFVRLSLPDNARLEPVIAEAQARFAAINSRRNALAQTLRDNWSADQATARLCILTGHTFKLWQESGLALTEIAAGWGAEDVVTIDADDPASASTLKLVEAAVSCRAVLMADVCRGDLPNLLPPNQPIFTWVTTPRMPAAAAAGPNDRLLLADGAWMQQAIAASWKQSSIRIAAWPALSMPETSKPDSSATPSVAIIANVSSLEPPERLQEFSSHLLLWNSLRQELVDDPFAAGTDAEAFLQSRMSRYGVDDVSFDRRLFTQALIGPAVALGIARRLASAAKLRLYGEGWESFPELAGLSAGPVQSREDLARAAADATVLVDVRPVRWRNALYALGRPVVPTAGRTERAVLAEIAAALAGKIAAEASPRSINIESIIAML